MSTQLDALRAHVGARPAAAASAATNVAVVGSGKGGSGTSVVAALVALAAAALGRRTLLVDADPFVGPLRYLLGAAPAATLADLRRGVPLERVVTPVSATLSLVAGGPGVAGVAGASSLGTSDAAEQRLLLARLKTHYPAYDSIVIDGGSRLDTVCACCDAGTGPARLLVVTGTDPIALAASYALVKAVSEGRRELSTEVVVNRQDEDGARRGFAQIETAARAFLGLTVSLAGVVPDDASLGVALRAGMPLHEAAAGSPAAVATHTIAERLVASQALHAAPAPPRPPRPMSSPLRPSLLSPAPALGATR